MSIKELRISITKLRNQMDELLLHAAFLERSNNVLRGKLILFQKRNRFNRTFKNLKVCENRKRKRITQGEVFLDGKI
jgi:hypothetical protein